MEGQCISRRVGWGQMWSFALDMFSWRNLMLWRHLLVNPVMEVKCGIHPGDFKIPICFQALQMNDLYMGEGIEQRERDKSQDRALRIEEGQGRKQGGDHSDLTVSKGGWRPTLWSDLRICNGLSADFCCSWISNVQSVQYRHVSMGKSWVCHRSVNIYSFSSIPFMFKTFFFSFGWS